MTTKKQQSQQGDHAIHRHVFVHFTSPVQHHRPTSKTSSTMLGGDH